MFSDYVNVHTNQDGGNLGIRLNRLFEVLDTKPENRMTNLDPALANFPYVNGGLFEGKEHLNLVWRVTKLGQGRVCCTDR